MRSILRLLSLVVVFLAALIGYRDAKAAGALLCCEMDIGAQCQWNATGSCPAPTWEHEYISVAAPGSNPSPSGAQVNARFTPPFSGVCFTHAAGTVAGQYVVPEACFNLIAPPTGGGPLIQVSETLVPYNGNAFAFDITPNDASWFNYVYMNCYAGSSLKDDQGVVTHAVGTGYTCGPLKQMTTSTSGAGGGNFHYLPSVNQVPDLGINPRLYAGYGSHLYWHYDLFLVRNGSPNSSITWRRTINGVTQPAVTLGTTDQYGSADVWFSQWLSSDVGANTLWATAGSFFTTNTLTFQVQY
jgi:hypothetical protein